MYTPVLLIFSTHQLMATSAVFLHSIIHVVWIASDFS